MAQVQMSVPKAPSAMMLVVNRYGMQCVMPHFVPVNKPKESVIVSDMIVKEILEEMFQIVGLNIGKVLIYTHAVTNH